MGQSLAIARYISRAGKLQGDTDREFAMSEQLIQEGEDLYMALAKAHYSPDRTAAMDTLFGTGLAPHLDALAKLLTGETFTGRLLAGDLAIFVIFDILVCSILSMILPFNLFILICLFSFSFYLLV